MSVSDALAVVASVVATITAWRGWRAEKRRDATAAAKAEQETKDADLGYTEKVRELTRKVADDLLTEVGGLRTEVEQCTQLVDSLRAYLLLVLAAWPRAAPPPPAPPPTLGVRWPPAS